MFNTLEQIAEAHSAWVNSDNPRVALGFPFFDDATGGGCGQGELVVCMGAEGTGKTWWACNVIANNPHVPTAVFSRRLQERILLQRLATVHTGQPTREIEREMLERGRSDAIERTVSDFPNLAVTSVSQMSLDEMSGAMRAFADDTHMAPRLVVIDDFDLVEADATTPPDDRATSVTRDLKAWARQHQVTVLVLAESGPIAQRRSSGSPFFGFFRRSPSAMSQFAPVSRSDATCMGVANADYAVGLFRAVPDPSPSPTESEVGEDAVLMLQLLKNNGGRRLHLEGVAHDACHRSWRVTPQH